MSPLTQRALVLLRLIAFGLVLVGGMLLGLELTLVAQKRKAFELWPCAKYLAPLALGIYVFARSKAWARAWADDEEGE